MQDARKTILCVGPVDVTATLKEPLQADGWRVHVAGNPRNAAGALLEHRPQVGLVICPDLDSVRCAELDTLLCRHSEPEWVGCFSPASSAEPPCRDLILSHLFDHHTLPIDRPRLLSCVGHAYGRAVLREQARTDAIPGREESILGQSLAIVDLLRQARRVACSTAPVLIHGESGTGKELVALAVHRHSPRARGPFVPINCGAIPPALIHSELFGHEKGAFTGATSVKHGLFEAAQGGTVFLDEIGDLPLELQANLLRFLQEGTIVRVGASFSLQLDVRVIAATHVDLAKAVAAGTFRQDLFYRLDVLPLRIKPLRERKEDIKVLALHFFRQFAREKRPALKGLSRSAISAMEAHPWPGNVRELMNRMRSGMLMAEGKLLMPADLGLEAMSGHEGSCALDDARLLAERRAISAILHQTGRNIAGAARQLGVSRMTLYRLMAKHGISHLH